MTQPAAAYAAGEAAEGAEPYATVELGDEPVEPVQPVPTPAGDNMNEKSEQVTKTMSSVSETIHENMTSNLDGEVNIALNHDIYNAFILLITGGVWSRKMNTSQKISMAFLTFLTFFIQITSILTMYWAPTDYPTRNWSKASKLTPYWIRCLGISLLIGNVAQMFRESTVFYNLCVQFPDMQNEHMLMFLILYGYNATLFFYTVSMVQRLIQWQEDPVDALLQVVAVHFINEIDDYMLVSLTTPVSLYITDEAFDESFKVKVDDPSELNVFGHLISNEGYVTINSIIMLIFMWLAFIFLDHENSTIDLPTLRDNVAFQLVLLPVILAVWQRRKTHDTFRSKVGFYFLLIVLFALEIWAILILADVGR